LPASPGIAVLIEFFKAVFAYSANGFLIQACRK